MLFKECLFNYLSVSCYPECIFSRVFMSHFPTTAVIFTENLTGYILQWSQLFRNSLTLAAVMQVILIVEP